MPRFHTGDIVLFSGTGTRSSIIKRFTKSAWSHVGMVLRLEGHSQPFLYESTSIGVLPDVHAGEIVSGVQTVGLEERIARYPGPVSVRTLLEEPSREMLAALNAMHIDLRGRSYETNDFELVKSAYDGPMGANVCDTTSLFCSELVAFAYQVMGLLSKQEPANEYTPMDFSESGRISLVKSQLSEEIVIKT